MASSSPIAQNERIIIVDVLRGFALFGVLLGNFSGMLTNYVPASMINAISSPVDETLDVLHEIFIQNKFMTLFSILFGYGFGVLMERAEKKNLNTTQFFLRRMFWLFVFGCLHLAFWPGDILHVYAVAGIFLLLFRQTSNRAIFQLSLFFMFVLPFIIRLYQKFMIHSSFDYDALQVKYYDTIKYGSLKDVGVLIYQSYPRQWIYNLVDFRDLSETVGRFLFGYYVVRRQVLVHIDTYYSGIRTIWKGSLAVMLVYVALWLLFHYDLIPSTVWTFPILRAGAFGTTIFYATSIILMFQKGTAGKLMEGFRSIGRMTLTNYLLQTAAYIIIFYHLGFGLLGEWPLHIIWIASVLLYVCQIMISRWWLSRYLYGPAEWVWRQLTYQKRFPLKA